MRLRTFLLEAEGPGRRRLLELLKADAAIEIVGQCHGQSTTAAVLREAEPELVFLGLASGKGFSLLDAAALEPEPAMVVIAARAEEAVQAFERGVVDFLLKPFSAARLRTALGRVRDRLATRNRQGSAGVVGTESPPPLARFVVRNGRQLDVVPIAQVDWIVAAGNYALLHVGAHTHILRETLASLEARLARAQFARVNRSTLVNLHRVSAVLTDDDGATKVALLTGDRLPLTRGVRELQARLERG
jgi:two-component system LytT family response regulator